MSPRTHQLSSARVAGVIGSLALGLIGCSAPAATVLAPTPSFSASATTPPRSAGATPSSLPPRQTPPAPSVDTTSKEFLKAQETVKRFDWEMLTTLTDFSSHPNPAWTTKNAKKYLALKEHSTMALVNFTDVPMSTVQALARVVEQDIPRVTGGGYEVDVTVFRASDLARAVFEHTNPGAVVTYDGDRTFAAVIAAAVMPGHIDEQFQTIIALTDKGCLSERGPCGGITTAGGRFADIAEYSRKVRQAADPSDNVPAAVIEHEWIAHALGGLGHARSVTHEGVELFPYSLERSGSDSDLRVDLALFLDRATVDEYRDDSNPLAAGDAQRLATLTPAQMYVSEYAERVLREPHTITPIDLRATPARIDAATSKRPPQTLAVVRFEAGIAVERVYLSELIIEPEYVKSDDGPGSWWCRIVGIEAADNGDLEFGHIALSRDPSDGLPSSALIDLPGDVTPSSLDGISIAVGGDGNLVIRLL